MHDVSFSSGTQYSQSEFCFTLRATHSNRSVPGCCCMIVFALLFQSICIFVIKPTWAFSIGTWYPWSGILDPCQSTNTITSKTICSAFLSTANASFFGTQFLSWSGLALRSGLSVTPWDASFTKQVIQVLLKPISRICVRNHGQKWAVVIEWVWQFRMWPRMILCVCVCFFWLLIFPIKHCAFFTNWALH